MLAASGCATIADIDTEERERRETDNKIIRVSNSNNEKIALELYELERRLERRIEDLEHAQFGEWNSAYCAERSEKIRKLLGCKRLPPEKSAPVPDPEGS